MERSVSFYSDHLSIEARLEKNTSPRGIVITHPHPLYGGNMDNPVVGAIRKAYRQKGFTTLRFDFRGTGRSQGNYDDGRGEQSDVRAAVQLLQNSGLEEIHLAGYSFSAWVNVHAVAAGLNIEQMVMVSPPVAMMDFDAVGFLKPLVLVITGGRDDIAPSDRIKQYLPVWNPDARLDIIATADHFYGGRMAALEAALA